MPGLERVGDGAGGHGGRWGGALHLSGTFKFVKAGTCIVDAKQAGNANYTAAPPVQQDITVP
ncbi:MAG TPA: hypothetical protein VG346_08120 [Acidimicrobiales bacterium]|nr:hypothetical protein [Acidimicrobiales bacterium]